MCGIAGYVTAARDDRTIERQLDLLMHRGPDARGVFNREGGVIGQTRLSIIDLETGDPPITDEVGHLGAVLNGEIYNFRALRKELGTAGHSFSTRGDTEVIAHLSEGRSAVDVARALDGMFAFATWDADRHELVIGRDRLGKKPLYYWSNDTSFVFASEIKALLAHPLVPRRLNPDAVALYLTFGFVPGPDTFFDGINVLPPGHVMTVRAGYAPLLEEYWRPGFPGATETDPLEDRLDVLAERLRGLLSAAVEKRLVADVPLGVFLSGGVDSAAITGIAAKMSSEPLRTFTMGFRGDTAFDERAYARIAAERFKTDHTEFLIEAKALELVERIVWHCDQPFADASAVPTFLLAEQTRPHVTVALSGDGGDELFAGYERFTAALAVDRLRVIPKPVLTGVKSLVGALPPASFGSRGRTIHRFLERSDAGLPGALVTWQGYLSERDRVALLDVGVQRSNRAVSAAWDQSRGAAILDRLRHFNLTTYLADGLLVKADRMSMAHALEVRSPFLDRAVVDFSLRLPRRALVRGLNRKRILRHAVADLVPQEILKRPKRGFGLPLDRWFREELKDHSSQVLCGRASRVGQHVNSGAVRAIVQEHSAGSHNHGEGLWLLLVLESFLRSQDW